MRRVLYLSHPQVAIDPAVAVTEWNLSPLGRSRAALAASADWSQGVTLLVSSNEPKAMQTAATIGGVRQLQVNIYLALCENDRSGTGYLPPPEFERMADSFFARPGESVRGWERAVDAQARTIQVVAAVMQDPTPGDVLIVGHGGVGTLLLCHLLNEPISRRRDQLNGGGNVFCFDAATRRVLHPWLPLEDPGVGLARLPGLG